MICAAITSKMNKAKLPTHIEISTRDYNIVKNSVILLEQIRTIDKQRLKEYVCHIDSAMMQKVDKAIRISLEIGYIDCSDFFTEDQKSDKIVKQNVRLSETDCTREKRRGENLYVWTFKVCKY